MGEAIENFETTSRKIDLDQAADCASFVIEHGIDVDRLFTHRFKLDQAEAAYQLLDSQTIGKGVFEF
jgi:threonine dehydrogenase-like Zn-dependent dehydrogenase